MAWLDTAVKEYIGHTIFISKNKKNKHKIKITPTYKKEKQENILGIVVFLKKLMMT